LRYALLIYGNTEVRDRRPDAERRRINAGVSAVLARPNVTGWLRLRNVESATTMRYEQGRTLLTDGPFVDSKDFLGGFIVVEADNPTGWLITTARNRAIDRIRRQQTLAAKTEELKHGLRDTPRPV
jgi:hypothetical protein